MPRVDDVGDGSPAQGADNDVNRAGTGAVKTDRPGRELATKLLAVVVPLSVALPFIALSALSVESDSGAVQHSGHVLHDGSTGRQLLWFTGFAGLQLHTPPACVNASSVPEAAKYVGIAIGWISAVVYLCSRIPQVRPRRHELGLLELQQ